MRAWLRNLVITVFMATCSYVAGYKLGVDEGLRSVDAEVTNRLQYIEEQLSLIDRRSYANSDSLEVVVGSLAEVHRRTIRAEEKADESLNIAVSMKAVIGRRK